MKSIKNELSPFINPNKKYDKKLSLLLFHTAFLFELQIILPVLLIFKYTNMWFYMYHIFND